MKKYMMALVASCIAAPACAADYLAPESAYDWTGFYVGAHVGGGWGKFHDVGNPSASEQETEGVFGGGQIGADYQTSVGIVLGLEADVSVGDIGKEWGGANEFDPYFGEDKNALFGTVRGRLGYAFDRFMPYVTGGLAWSNNEHTLGCDADRVEVTLGCQRRDGFVKFENEVEDTVLGFAVGGGVEYAFADNWSFRAQYLFADFGKNEEFIADPNYPLAGDRDFENHMHRVDVGLNYRF